MNQLKLSYEETLNRAMKVVRDHSFATDALVILFDPKTGEVKMKTLRGDQQHMIALVKMLNDGLQKQKASRSGIWMP